MFAKNCKSKPATTKGNPARKQCHGVPPHFRTQYAHIVDQKNVSTPRIQTWEQTKPNRNKILGNRLVEVADQIVALNDTANPISTANLRSRDGSVVIESAIVFG